MQKLLLVHIERVLVIGVGGWRGFCELANCHGSNQHPRHHHCLCPHHCPHCPCLPCCPDLFLLLMKWLWPICCWCHCFWLDNANSLLLLGIDADLLLLLANFWSLTCCIILIFYSVQWAGKSTITSACTFHLGKAGFHPIVDSNTVLHKLVQKLDLRNNQFMRMRCLLQQG